MAHSVLDAAEKYAAVVSKNHKLKNELAQKMISDSSLTHLDMEELYEECELKEHPLRLQLASLYCESRQHLRDGFFKEVSASTYKMMKITAEIICKIDKSGHAN